MLLWTVNWPFSILKVTFSLYLKIFICGIHLIQSDTIWFYALNSCSFAFFLFLCIVELIYCPSLMIRPTNALLLKSYCWVCIDSVFITLILSRHAFSPSRAETLTGAFHFTSLQRLHYTMFLMAFCFLKMLLCLDKVLFCLFLVTITFTLYLLVFCFPC